MRTLPEIRFRLRQEAGNLRLLVRPPRLALDAHPLPSLPPDPAPIVRRLASTSFAAEVLPLAESIRRHCFPLLGITVDTGPRIAWRRDYVSGIESPPSYFRLLPYLNAARVGDHKVIWELSRHQHLVLLAQASLLTGRPEFFEEACRQWSAWVDDNPYMRGMNWASALEVAFRALSWLWFWRLGSARMDAEFRRRFLSELYRHGLYLRGNLSIYFSRNTHVLGEAVALHALGAAFPLFPESARWKETGARVVREQMRLQVRPDGSHFEQSSYYHVYALDMFLFHRIMAGSVPGEYDEGLRRMAGFLHSLLGAAGVLPPLGDEDGGRFFHPYGSRDRFARDSLAACAAFFERPSWLFQTGALYSQAAWWLGESGLAVPPGAGAAPETSRLFPDAGLAVLAAGGVHAVADAGPLGAGSAGHGHADALSIVVRAGAEVILTDPGTFTYVGDERWRNWFRGTAAHNTVRIDGLDQASPAGPFRWSSRPETSILAWRTSETGDYLDARCRYREFAHRRRIYFAKPDLFFILDEVEGPPGDRLVEQFWHPAGSAVPIGPGAFRLGSRARLLLCGAAAECETGGEHGWLSPAFGVRKPAPVIRAHVRGTLPVYLGAVLDLSGAAGPATLCMERTPDAVVLTLPGTPARTFACKFPDAGEPQALP